MKGYKFSLHRVTKRERPLQSIPEDHLDDCVDFDEEEVANPLEHDTQTQRGYINFLKHPIASYIRSFHGFTLEPVRSAKSLNGRRVSCDGITSRRTESFIIDASRLPRRVRHRPPNARLSPRTSERLSY